MSNTNNDIDKKEFADRLQSLFDESGRKSLELEMKLNVGRATVSRWRNGHTLPNTSQIKEIASFFNVRYDWLLGVDNNDPCLGNWEIGEAIKKSKEFPDYMKSLGYSFAPGDYIYEDKRFKKEKCIIEHGSEKIEITWEQYHELKRKIESFIRFTMTEQFEKK